MSYRPYPNVDRALRQLDRHYPDPPAAEMPEGLRPLAESFAQLRRNTQRAAEQGFGAGTYVLSTRRDAGQLITGFGSSGVTVNASDIRPWTRAEIEGSPRPGAVGGPS